jgi:predicted ATPase
MAFDANAMSDGTLRAFGILLAVFQAASARPAAKPPLLIGLEEPEMPLHPAAGHVLLSALREAREQKMQQKVRRPRRGKEVRKHVVPTI